MMGKINASLRRKVLREWRRLPHQATNQRKDFSIRKTVKKILCDLNLQDALTQEEIARAWVSIVGEFIARHTCPQKIDRGTLKISVLQPSIRYTLETDLKKDILQKLKNHLGEDTIKNIHFYMG